jgi:hypothetical protein
MPMGRAQAHGFGGQLPHSDRRQATTVMGSGANCTSQAIAPTGTPAATPSGAQTGVIETERVPFEVTG